MSKEIKDLPSQLSQYIYGELMEKIACLDQAHQFYTSYVEYYFQRKPADSMPTLGYLIKSGNRTVYEWRTGSQPVQVDKKSDIDYDFGDDYTASVAAGGQDTIDFDIVDFSVDTDTMLAGGDAALESVSDSFYFSIQKL